MSSYISHFDYIRSPSGLETASLLGNSLRLSSAAIAGATSLSVTPNTTVALAVNDRLTIFDGASSEVVFVAGTTNTGSSGITIQSPGLQYAHAQYTPLCSDGVLGSLADQIINASTWLETICQQSLLQATYTNETLRMPSMRASIDAQGQLNFRPRHFPITAENGITIITNSGVANTYDATQCIIATDHQIVSVPWLVATGNQSSNANIWLSPAPSRQQTMWLQITYTAGYAQAAIPGDVKDAAILLVSDMLSRRQNPTGASSISLGDKSLQAGSRDTSGESDLVKRAKQILVNYSIKPF